MKNKHHLLIIVLSGLILRLLWVFLVSVPPKSDFETYYVLARSLTVNEIEYKDYIAVFPHIIGYPFVLSLFFKVFGSSITTAQMLNIVLSCGIIILSCVLGNIIMNERCGLIASVFLAFWPSQIFYTTFVSADTMYTFLVLLFCVFFIYIIKRCMNTWCNVFLFILLGILGAFTNAIRPFGPILITAVLIFLFLFQKETQNIYKKFRFKIIICFVFIAAYLVLTQFINLQISDKIQKKASSSVGYSLNVGMNYEYKGAWNEEDAELLNQLMTDGGYSTKQIQGELLKNAFTRLKENEGKNIVLLFNKFKNTWTSDSEALWYIRDALEDSITADLSINGFYTILLFISDKYYQFGFLLFVLCTFYIIKTKNFINNYLIFLMLIVLGIISVHLIVETSSRYHYPAIPIISVTIGYYIENLIKNGVNKAPASGRLILRNLNSYYRFGPPA